MSPTTRRSRPRPCRSGERLVARLLERLITLLLVRSSPLQAALARVDDGGGGAPIRTSRSTGVNVEQVAVQLGNGFRTRYARPEMARTDVNPSRYTSAPPD